MNTWQSASAAQKPLVRGRFRVKCASTEVSGTACGLLGRISKRGLAFMPQSREEEARCHCKELLNFNDLFYYVVEGSIVSLSPASKKRINWTENGGAEKLTVIRGDVNG